jgi:two-component system LytT family response regulator
LIGERERRLYPLHPDRVDYIEANGNYVSIHSDNAAYISRDTIKRLAAVLADSGFIRIERSLLVNVRAVLYVESAGRGRFAFTLSCGVCLQSSATYRQDILRTLPLASYTTRRGSAA